MRLPALKSHVDLGDHQQWHCGHSCFLSINFPLNALCDGFCCLFWMPSAKDKQTGALKVTAAALSFALLQHTLM